MSTNDDTLMNILVFGKDGQLGKAFQGQLQYSSFQTGNTIRFVGRNECDLNDTSQITDLINTFKPQLLINTAAYTSVDKAETESDLAFEINATAPEVMAKYAASHGATLLHFSTNYVFDGSKLIPYTEADKTNPLSAYGKSKEAGERAILNAFSNSSIGQYAILRTGWVYGDGDNFIRTILLLAKERTSIRVINDQYGVPTNATWLAEVGCYLTIDVEKPRQFNSGIYHAVPEGGTNWYNFGCLAIQSALDAGQQLETPLTAVIPIPASEYPLPAPRPMNSRLSTNKLQIELERLGLVSKLPHLNTPWDEQVATYVKRLSKN